MFLQRPASETKHIDYYVLRKYYERDSTYLGLIDAFLQDGPQLVLQLYILAKRDPDDLAWRAFLIWRASPIILMN